MYGYVGKLLFVNLSNNTYDIRDLEESFAKTYVGGHLMGARVMYDEMEAGTGAFDEASVIGFMGGPLNNTKAFVSGRYTVVSKSPVYDGFNDCNSGGYFAPMLKKSGFDAVFVKGISDKPVYILLDDGEVSFHDASDLWGKTVKQTEECLEKELGSDKKFNAAIIGPGGERLSYMAAIMNDSHRAAARGGSGAVMGSKKLKALVVRGNHIVEVADPEGLVETNKMISTAMTDGPMKDYFKGFRTLGTLRSVSFSMSRGDGGVKNYFGSYGKDYSEEDCQRLDPMNYDGKYKIKTFGCANCPFHCGAIYDLSSIKYPVEGHSGRPEYETGAAFGSMVLNGDVDVMLYCNELCNEYGLDTISVGATVAWVMDCYELGYLTKADIDGIEAAWGSPEAIVELTKKICAGEGCGEILQYGSYWASKKYGVGEDRVVAASGIEPAQHSSLFSPGLARTYKYDPTPGRHVKGGLGTGWPVAPPYLGTGYLDMTKAIKREFITMAGTCILIATTGIPDITLRLTNAVTGWGLSNQDEINYGLRTLHMRQAFNVREGRKRSAFWMSDVLRKAPENMGGPLQGVDIDVESMADSFFDVIGWTRDMVPSKEALMLAGGLDDLVPQLYPPRQRV